MVSVEDEEPLVARQPAGALGEEGVGEVEVNGGLVEPRGDKAVAGEVEDEWVLLMVPVDSLRKFECGGRRG